MVHCNIAKNGYQHDSIVLYTFTSNQSFDQLLFNSTKNIVFLTTFHSENLYNDFRSTGRNSKLLQTEDKLNINLVIN